VLKVDELWGYGANDTSFEQYVLPVNLVYWFSAMSVCEQWATTAVDGAD